MAGRTWIRLGSPQDTTDVLALMARGTDHRWTPDQVAMAIGPEAGRYVVLARILGDRRIELPAGFCSAQVVLDEVEIHEIVVAPEQRRRGLGRTLLDACLGLARARGARIAHLEVRRSNSAAVNLYRAAGFAPVGVRRGYYHDPCEDALLLSRLLAPPAPRV